MSLKFGIILMIHFLYVLLAMLISSTVTACPFCLSKTSKLVYSGIFNHQFVLYFIYTILPFFIFYILVWFLANVIEEN
ncbi:Uncharacterised protein [Legionella wadsworthii]|uniref:Uncharacterized protein n=1 Tax=Legionella wadsworthii TaxID=28088 RepID=A0A378LYN4_9GAMM|nr:hypothetical protein [Legionella wadsworthii]STY29181.1 Uncharacterised protein [Legionella wadsworthii]